jgi:hypothetical protein
MELLKIIGGLATIVVLVVIFGTGGGGGEDETSAAAAATQAPVERSFTARDSSARFVPVGD